MVRRALDRGAPNRGASTLATLGAMAMLEHSATLGVLGVLRGYEIMKVI